MVWDGNWMQDSHIPPPPFSGNALQAADISQIPPLATAANRRRWMTNIQLFWNEGMPHSSSPCSASPGRSSSSLQGSPTSSLASQQCQSHPWQCCTTMVTVCMGAKVTLECARSGRGCVPWGESHMLSLQVHQNLDLSGYYIVLK